MTNELQDPFLYSGKDRPELYFDSAIRADISSFVQWARAAELLRCCAPLGSAIAGDSSAAGVGVVHLRESLAAPLAAELAARLEAAVQ